MMLMRLCSKTEHFSMFIIYSVNVSYFLKIYINFTHVNRCHKMKGTHFYCYLSNTLIRPVSSLSLLLSVGFFFTFFFCVTCKASLWCFSTSSAVMLYLLYSLSWICSDWALIEEDTFILFDFCCGNFSYLSEIFRRFMERMYKSEKNSYVWFFLIYQTWIIKWLKLDSYPYILVN